MNTLAATPPPSSSSPPAPGNAPSPMASRLAYAGLLPFVFGAALTWIVRPDAHPYVVDALAKYGALIVSFLGGLHWGLAMRAGSAVSERMRDTSLIWGVTPSLLAWIAAIMPPYSGLVILGVLLVACYLVDRRRYPLFNAAPWLTLRFRLTAVASLSCFIAATGA